MFYIVSGGPGNSIEYLTLKGYRLLKKADVVFYHTLFDTSKLLEVCKNNCQKISVQDMKTKDRVEFVKNNPKKLCIELMSGDVAWFSTAQGMIDILVEEKIPFEIVPGVSSISMASAILKNELVLPCISQCCIVTYLERIPMIDKQSIEKLASHNATIVVMMAHEANIPKLKEQLLSGGISKDTPVCVVYRATYPTQSVFNLTVDTIDTLKGDLWHCILIIGWVLADKQKRNEISGLPFTVGFSKSEDYKESLNETKI